MKERIEKCSVTITQTQFNMITNCSREVVCFGFGHSSLIGKESEPMVRKVNN